jgi:methylated-DNA-[protein]-cysteine S-methyltransferase
MGSLMIAYGIYRSSLGIGVAAWNEAGVLRIAFPGGAKEDYIERLQREFGELHEGQHLILTELEAYFRGELRQFQSKPFLPGTSFQRDVWRALVDIPYGETRTYGELAALIKKPKAARAVGSACGKNPVPILVPCHRVVAGEGLGGFGGGLELKRWLLSLEASHRNN